MLKTTLAATAIGFSTLLSPLMADAAEVNLYSARIEALIKPILDEFTAETGIRVNLVTGGADELLQRLQSEGRNTPADILLTTDAGRLHRAKAAGLLQTFASKVVTLTLGAEEQ